MLFGREKKIENLISKYIILLKQSIDSFEKGFNVFISEGVCSEFDKTVLETHEIESKMDEIKRDIAYEMYSKTILPESRGGLLQLIERADKIPGIMQSVLFDIKTEALTLPDVIREDVSSLIKSTCVSCRHAADSFDSVFSKTDKVMEYAKQADEFESICDHLERRIISSVFLLPIDSGSKVLFKLFIERIGTASDCAENMADASVILSVKGQI